MATCYLPVQVRVADPVACEDCQSYCILAEQTGVNTYTYQCIDTNECLYLISLCKVDKFNILGDRPPQPCYRKTLVEVADENVCKKCKHFRLQPETLFDDGDQPRQHYACQHLDECQRKIAHFREAGIK